MSNSLRTTVAILLAVTIGAMSVQLTLAAPKSPSQPRQTSKSESGRKPASDALLGAAAAVAVTGVVLTVLVRPTYETYNPDTGEHETRDVQIDSAPFYWTAMGLLAIAAIASLRGGADDAGDGHAGMGSSGAIPGEGATLIGVGPRVTSDSIALAIEIGF